MLMMDCFKKSRNISKVQKKEIFLEIIQIMNFKKIQDPLIGFNMTLETINKIDQRSYLVWVRI